MKGVTGLRADQRSGALRDSAARSRRRVPDVVSRQHMESLAARRAALEASLGLQRVGVGPPSELCVLMEELGLRVRPTPFFGSAVLALPVLEAIGSELAVRCWRRADRDDGAGGPRLWVMNDGRSRASCRRGDRDVVLAVDGSGVVSRLGRRPELHRLDNDRPEPAAVRRGAPTVPRPWSGRSVTDSLARVIARAKVALAAEQGRDRAALFTKAPSTRRPRPVLGADRLVPGHPAQARRREPRRRAGVEPV